jgi:hypothetical protein
MEERLHRAGAFGVDLVQSVHGLVHLHTQFDFPPHAVEVNHLSRARPWGGNSSGRSNSPWAC